MAELDTEAGEEKDESFTVFYDLHGTSAFEGWCAQLSRTGKVKLSPCSLSAFVEESLGWL